MGVGPDQRARCCRQPQGPATEAAVQPGIDDEQRRGEVEQLEELWPHPHRDERAGEAEADGQDRRGVAQ